MNGQKASQPVLRQLPSLDRLLKAADGQTVIELYGLQLVTRIAREHLSVLRTELAQQLSNSASQLSFEPQALLTESELWGRIQLQCAQAMQSSLKPVINLTGTVIHTNLGRAVLADEALAQIQAVMQSPCNLEFDLERGERGERDDHIEQLLCKLTGAQAATVVNNNAAAVVLSLAALSKGREVIISRGEQVEIGGAFRMPDVMKAAGAKMIEVGTTNRTHLSDYAQAVSPKTAVLMKVHTSNYQVVGFTQNVSEGELASLSRTHSLFLVSDLGSGSLIDLRPYGLPHEPTPQELLAAGCDVVTFSGDKLLGGPQAGLIVGSHQAIQKIRKHPLKRALRISKLPLAALEATLKLYLRPERLVHSLPTLRYLSRDLFSIRQTAQALHGPLQTCLGQYFEVQLASMHSQIGSGALPIDLLPSEGVTITPKATLKRGRGSALKDLASALRSLPVPVIGRIQDDQLYLDCRCLEGPERVLEQLTALSALITKGRS